MKSSTVDPLFVQAEEEEDLGASQLCNLVVSMHSEALGWTVRRPWPLTVAAGMESHRVDWKGKLKGQEC